MVLHNQDKVIVKVKNCNLSNIFRRFEAFQKLTVLRIPQKQQPVARQHPNSERQRQEFAPCQYLTQGCFETSTPVAGHWGSAVYLLDHSCQIQYLSEVQFHFGSFGYFLVKLVQAFTLILTSYINVDLYRVIFIQLFLLTSFIKPLKNSPKINWHHVTCEVSFEGATKTHIKSQNKPSLWS